MPRDAVSRTANVERTGQHKWVNVAQFYTKYYIWILETDTITLCSLFLRIVQSTKTNMKLCNNYLLLFYNLL